jgi:hypothetical protein
LLKLLGKLAHGVSYSPNSGEEVFCEVREYGVIGSSSELTAAKYRSGSEPGPDEYRDAWVGT